MIIHKQGDILRDESEAVVNTVNCVGVMGRGIALQFRNAYPENFRAYEKACNRGELQPGKMFVFETGGLTNPRFIINFPTKRHWRGNSRMEDIDSGLKALIQVVKDKGIRSLAVPPLGCGLGGLDWSMVKPAIESALGELVDVKVSIYGPGGAPCAETMVRNQKSPKMTPGRAALVELIHHYLGGLLDPFVTLLEVHKLLYFLQEAGEPLRLRFAKARYGPFAENLGHVLKAIEGHFLSGYADGGDGPGKQLTLVPGAYEEARSFLENKPSTRVHFQRVKELVTGFETPLGLELLATVHWIAKREHPESVRDLINSFHTWNEHKKGFTERQIRLAVQTLLKKHWIESPRQVEV